METGSEVRFFVCGYEYVGTVEEYCPADPTTGSWESGWYVDVDATVYFISVAGIVYGLDASVLWREQFTVAVGTCPAVEEVARRLAEDEEAMFAQLAEHAGDEQWKL